MGGVVVGFVGVGCGELEYTRCCVDIRFGVDSGVEGVGNGGTTGKDDGEVEEVVDILGDGDLGFVIVGVDGFDDVAMLSKVSANNRPMLRWVIIIGLFFVGVLTASIGVDVCWVSSLRSLLCSGVGGDVIAW